MHYKRRLFTIISVIKVTKIHNEKIVLNQKKNKIELLEITQWKAEAVEQNKRDYQWGWKTDLRKLSKNITQDFQVKMKI